MMLEGFNKTQTENVGTIKSFLNRGHKTVDVTFHVVGLHVHTIISKPFLAGLGVFIDCLNDSLVDMHMVVQLDCGLHEVASRQ